MASAMIMGSHGFFDDEGSELDPNPMDMLDMDASESMQDLSPQQLLGMMTPVAGGSRPTISAFEVSPVSTARLQVRARNAALQARSPMFADLGGSSDNGTYLELEISGQKPDFDKQRAFLQALEAAGELPLQGENVEEEEDEDEVAGGAYDEGMQDGFSAGSSQEDLTDNEGEMAVFALDHIGHGDEEPDESAWISALARVLRSFHPTAVIDAEQAAKSPAAAVHSILQQIRLAKKPTPPQSSDSSSCSQP